MAKKSVKISTAAAAMTESVARLRLLDKTRTDWAFSAEGFPLLKSRSTGRLDHIR